VVATSELPLSREANRLLRIAQVAPLWLPVPPGGYGGAERIIDLLARWLVEQGHQVTLVASGDSSSPAHLQPVVPCHLTRLMREGAAASYHHYVAASVAWVLQHQHRFDVIHMHVEPHWIPVMAAAQRPVVFRLNTALSPDDVWALENNPGVHATAISHRQLAGLAAEARGRIPVIYNGCDFGDFRLGDRHEGYLAFLSRMGRHKNPVAAIEIARRAGMPLVLAGAPVDARESRYFEREVRPLIDGRRVRYLGAVGGARKRALLRGAAALLFPVQWEEPFGIVMIEAMACGTPVLACARGAVPEVVDRGVTGFYADSPEELAPLVPEALALPRRAVRRRAEERFSHRRMGADYLKLYARLAAAAAPRDGRARV
jgi:glycosyltransferase involved in cell wall biosynthesis